MNWKRLYATLQIGLVTCSASALGASLPAIIAIGVCRRLIGVSDNVAVFGVGLPLFIVLFPIFVKGLKEPLRKAGMLSDDPTTFGSWFED